MLGRRPALGEFAMAHQRGDEECPEIEGAQPQYELGHLENQDGGEPAVHAQDVDVLGVDGGAGVQ